jgi:4-hydroxy-tetrahydrodipicolinate synthase
MTALLELRGLVVATVLPFTDEGDVDWPSYHRLLEHCAVPDCTAAVFVNGHAGEGAALDDSTRVRVIHETRRVIGKKPLLAGVIALSTEMAVRQAQLAEEAGADGVVPFPMSQFQAGGAASPEAPLAYIGSITEAVRIPLSIFQYPIGSGLSYSLETLSRFAAMPQVVAIKEGGDNMTLYEDTWRVLKRAKPSLSILPSNFDWFLAQLAVGADGILSGLASLAPHELHVLWDAAARSDLEAMRAASDRLYPLVRAIYATPRMDMHTRIKLALQHLGVIECARPRSPLLPVSEVSGARVIEALEAFPTRIRAPTTTSERRRGP